MKACKAAIYQPGVSRFGEPRVGESSTDRPIGTHDLARYDLAYEFGRY